MTAITDEFVLPEDVLVIPVTELAPEVRGQIDAGAGDYAVTRPRGRTPSRIVDAQFAALIERFRTPMKIAEAIFDYSRSSDVDPGLVLDEAFPLLMRLVESRFLVTSGSREADAVTAALTPGDRVLDGVVVLNLVQGFDDTELYQVRRSDGVIAALKIARDGAGERVAPSFEREAAILARLDGRVNPELLASGRFERRPYLLIAWRSGVDAASAAAEARDDPERVRALGVRILDAYAHLHTQGIVHGDVHPRNVLVARDGSITILDYGLAVDDEDARNLPGRGGVGFFYEPEFVRGTDSLLRPTQRGEQYAVAALLFSLFTGQHYLDFSLERNELFRQIAEDEPRSFESRGVRPWPAVEAALRTALAKQPDARFISMDAFARELDAAAPVSRPGPAGSPVAEESRRYAAAVIAHVGLGSTLLRYGLRDAPTSSLSYGAAGIAFALYRMACTRDDPALLALADLWSVKAAHDVDREAAFFNDALDLTPSVVGRRTPYHTESGVHAVRFLVAVAGGDFLTALRALDLFVATSRIACTSLDVTLGRSGTLLASSMLLDAMPQSEYLGDDALRRLGDEVAAEIWSEVDRYGEIPACGEIEYFGAAHGWAGIVFAALSWSLASGRPVPPSVRSRLEELAALREPFGSGARWRWHVHRSSVGPAPDYMTGWCNGSAGFVFLWTLAHEAFGDDRYLELAEDAAWNAWEGGAPIGNLCCGDAGRAYALLNVYRASGDARWLRRAEELAGRAMRAGDAPYQAPAVRSESLYKGQIGIALLACDLAEPQRARMPFFEREGFAQRYPR